MIRFLASDPGLAAAVVRSNVAEGVRAGGLLLGWREPTPGSPCWVFDLVPDAAFPDGTPLTAGDVARRWIDAAATRGSPAQWLLEALAEPAGAAQQGSIASAIQAQGPVLEVCPRRPTPDLPQRIEHPALWVTRDAGSGGVSGPGPFAQSPDGTLWPNPGFAGLGPYVDRVEPVAVEGDPTVPLRLGDAHVAVVYGKAARALRQDPGSSGLKLDRLPAWDRIYFLWMNPSKRWVNDPYFRRWLAGILDRDEMLLYLFDGQGSRAFSLSPSDLERAGYEPQPERRVSPNTVPRLELAFDATDPHARTLAQRIQAVLETQTVTLSLAALAVDDLRTRVSRGDVEIALLAHRPATADPLLGLLGSVWWLGPDEAPSRQALIERSSEIDPRQAERRWDAALTIERALLSEARLVPLIRLEAWLARHPGLAGVAPGPDGVLRLEEAWWLP